jgi:hypothetical protein
VFAGVEYSMLRREDARREGAGVGGRIGRCFNRRLHVEIGAASALRPNRLIGRMFLEFLARIAVQSSHAAKK